MTVLLVDSDKQALDREAKRLAGRQSGMMVVLHSSANDAIKFAMYHEVDVVFTRSVLAEMTGRELIEKIRRFKPEAECRILLKDEEIPLVQLWTKTLSSSDSKGTHNSLPEEKNETIKRTNVHRIENERPAGEHSCQHEQKKGDDDMTEQELRSLSRKELLEMMIEQGKELEFVKAEHKRDVEFLKAEHEKETQLLKEELEKVKKSLQNREIAINEAGSIAMAALQLNGVFEAAQAASQQYIENIRSLNDRQASICAKRDADSRAEADRRIRESAAKCEEMEAACREKCVAMEADAKQRSEAYWTEVSTRLQTFYENHQELKKLLNTNVPIPQI